MRISRNNTYVEAIGTAFRRRKEAFVDVIAVAADAAPFSQDRDSGIAHRIVFSFSVVSLHSHMLRVERPEMDARSHLQRIADMNILPILVTNLHVGNAHLRPVFPHLRLPMT